MVTNPFSLTYIEKESTLLDNMVYVYDVDSPYITRAEIDLYPEYEDGDALIDAVEERKQLYANNVPPRALPDGLDNITSSITTYSSTSNPGERNRVTISGIAPPEAYTFVFRSIKFQNNGPLITNVRRRIVFRVWDDLDATNDVPNPDEAMVSTRIMLRKDASSAAPILCQDEHNVGRIHDAEVRLTDGTVTSVRRRRPSAQPLTLRLRRRLGA